VYSHPSSSRGPGVHVTKATATLLAVVLVMILYSLVQKAGHQQSPPGVPAGVPAPEPSVPPVNPLERLLRPPDNVVRREGIGVVLLVDTTGSMTERVPDERGGHAAKIEIARRCALNLLRQCDAFARANPDRVVRVGVSEFSYRSDDRELCRVVIPLGPLDLEAASRAVGKMSAEGGTPIGTAIITAKKILDASGLTRLHILVVTDGENNVGYEPADVLNAMSLLPAENRAAVYFIAFDVAAAKFAKVREAGGLVLAATSGKELQQTLDYVLTGKILVEQSEAPKAHE